MHGEEKYKQKHRQYASNLNYFSHASDTTSTRSAGYIVYVYSENNVYYAKSGYGSLGKTYRENSLGAFARLNKAVEAAKEVMKKKTAKNYIEDYVKPFHSSPSPVDGTAIIKESPFPATIPVFSYDTAERLEMPLRHEWVEDDKVALEWYPNRTRIFVILMMIHGFAEYNSSGQKQSEHPYPHYFDTSSDEFFEIMDRGLIFTAYKDPSDNFVLLSYLRQIAAPIPKKNPLYMKQRSVMLMVLDVLCAKYDLDVFSSKNLLYANAASNSKDEKEDWTTMKIPMNRFANNLVVFNPSSTMQMLTTIER